MLLKIWLEIREPKDIFASLAPLLCVTFLCGLTPIGVGTVSGKRILKITCVGTTLAAFNVCSTVFWWFKMYYDHDHIIQDIVSVAGDTLQQYAGAGVVLVIYICSYWKRDSFVMGMSVLADIDEQLFKMGVKVKYKKMFHYSCLSFMLLVIFVVCYHTISILLLSSLDVHPGYAAYIFFFLQNAVVMVTVYMYRCLTRLISDRFFVLNKVLVNLIEQFVNKNDVNRKKSIPFTREPSDKFMSWVTVLKTHDETIEEVAHIHDMLCDLATITNDFFTVQMLAITGIAFLIIVFDAYYVLGTYLGLASFRATAFIIFFSSQLILHAIEVCVIVHGSSEAVSQSQMTSIYVHKLLNLTKVDSLKDVLYKLSLQLIHRKVVFDAAGFFVLDRTLFFTICGATTTYLIILLQFSSENDTKFETVEETTYASILNSSLTD